jgi:PPK2 family polyphosphate:nucleotide phosphotransferase
VIEALRVEPGTAANLAGRDPRDTLGLGNKRAAKAMRAELVDRLDVLQQRLFAESKRSLLLVLQGMDASGKDGVIRAVFRGINPLGCRAVSFRAPTSTELSHDYLWRIHAALPARGELGIFNRSHYEDVVAVRMHGLAPEDVWERRPGHIREWERMLTDENIAIVKVYLHVSREKQRERLQERVVNTEKRWKFRKDDLEVLARHHEYIGAYEDVLTATSTDWAPWHVVPADRNWVKSTAVAQLLVDGLEDIDPQLPRPEPGVETIQIP